MMVPPRGDGLHDVGQLLLHIAYGIVHFAIVLSY